MRAVCEQSRPGFGYFVRVPGMFHANLTGFPDWSPLFSFLGITGPISGPRAHRLINAYTLTFFDPHLKGLSTTLLNDPPSPYPTNIGGYLSSASDWCPFRVIPDATPAMQRHSSRQGS